MIASGFFGGRVVCVLVSLSLLGPGSAAAAPGQDVMSLNTEGQAQMATARAQIKSDPNAAAGQFVTAGDLFARAAGQLPEIGAARRTRDDLLRKAVSAYQQAHRLVSEDLTPLRTALALTRSHIAALERAYGDVAPRLSEYTHAQALVTQLQAWIGGPPVDETPPGPTPAPSVALPAPDRGTFARADWRRVGLGVSAALAVVSFGATLGTTFMISRKPFKGPLYADIENAAAEHDVSRSVNDDMCRAGAMFPDVADACGARDRMARTAVAMLVLTSVFSASAITFGVLLARSKRPRAEAMQRRAPGVAMAPLSGGVMLGAGARF